MTASEDGNTVVVFGGRIDLNATHVPPTNFTGTLYTLDVKTGSWSQGPDGDIRSYMACLVIGDQFVAWGGSDGTSSISGPPVIFNLQTRQWITTYTPPPYMEKMAKPSATSTPSGPQSGNPSGVVGSSSSSSSSSSTNLGAILGGVFGCLFVITMAGMVYLYVKRREDKIRFDSLAAKQQSNENPPQGSDPHREDSARKAVTSYLRDPQDASPMAAQPQYSADLKESPMSHISGVPHPLQPIIFTPTTMYAPAVATGVPVTSATPSHVSSRENYMTDLSGGVPMAYSGPTSAPMNVSSAYTSAPFQAYGMDPSIYGATTMAAMGNTPNVGVPPFGNNSNIPTNTRSEPIATTVNSAYIHPAGRVPLATTPATALLYLPPPPSLPQTAAPWSPTLPSESTNGDGGTMTPTSNVAATATTPGSTNASIAVTSEGSQGSPNIPPLPQRPVQNTNVRYTSVISGPIASVDVDHNGPGSQPAQ